VEEVNPLRSGVHSRGYLPHVKREGAWYFVTFRLADSLPKEVLMRLIAEREAKLRGLSAQPDGKAEGSGAPSNQEAGEEINREFNRQIERYLDRGTGECYLARPAIAELVSNALRFFETKRYRLNGWVVMPNHVHAVVWPMPKNLLSDILKSWKRFTARQANQMLGRGGQAFWQPESFDHWVRTDEERAKICSYVVHNPVKARLCAAPEEWHWSSAWPGWKQSQPPAAPAG
jgi:REP element-mobilizing transposase RayT